ncbi:hypothetical protein CONPUDRAFT_157518 [Coniophora puteana RWD-64-598 SS2]|uniref:Uncharacterized protein n=1 Tax=Coniophora puteana (strain RWD-64-598) TaxID=741705 RepID=A0A5M3ME26_CONPW|nr:uncharacterized protein CONPUDRAFT_157518 [Coniophora puteana RWD-64-598 SS2]EIW77256.1 hypothetical protein CONPUDRAFT_157518 [Coniophora puteana RWD-64-598 SS2]
MSTSSQPSYSAPGLAGPPPPVMVNSRPHCPRCFRCIRVKYCENGEAHHLHRYFLTCHAPGHPTYWHWCDRDEPDPELVAYYHSMLPEMSSSVSSSSLGTSSSASMLGPPTAAGQPNAHSSSSTPSFSNPHSLPPPTLSLPSAPQLPPLAHPHAHPADDTKCAADDTKCAFAPCPKLRPLKNYRCERGMCKTHCNDHGGCRTAKGHRPEQAGKRQPSCNSRSLFCVDRPVAH